MIEALDGCNECGSGRVDTELFTRSLGRVQKQLVACYFCHECGEEMRFSTTLQKVKA